MSTPSSEEVAAELVAARGEGRSLPGFPGVVPAGMAEAYRIQELAMSRWPDTVVGWKIGYIPADRRPDGAPDRLVGPVWRRQCQHADAGRPAPAMAIFPAGFAAVEAELVIRLGQELRPRDEPWTAAEAADLEQQLLVGIEVASSPVPDINALGPTVIAADFGNHNGLVLGPELAGSPDAAELRLACHIDGHLVGEGSGRNLPGGIHSGLATALDVLGHRGRTVPAGTVFATGAVTGIHPIRPGQHCRVEVSGGPAVELRTVEAGPTAPG